MFSVNNLPLFILLWCWYASAQSSVTVLCTDPRLAYVGDWTSQASNTYMFTSTPGGSVSLTFQGTTISWFSRRNPNAGIVNVTIDGSLVDSIDPSSGFSNQSQPEVLAELYSNPHLSVGSHSITVFLVAPGDFGGPFMENFYFIYTPSGSVSTPAKPTTAVTTTNATTVTTTNATTVATTARPSNGTSGIVLSAQTAIITSGVAATTTATTTTATNGNDTLSPANSPHNSSNHIALIGGVTAGAIGAFCLLASLIICIVRRRREQVQAENAVRVADPFTVQGDSHLPGRSSSEARLSGQGTLSSDAYTAMLEKSGHTMISDASRVPVPSSTVTSPTDLYTNDPDIGGPPPPAYA